MVIDLFTLPFTVKAPINVCIYQTLPQRSSRPEGHALQPTSLSHRPNIITTSWTKGTNRVEFSSAHMCFTLPLHIPVGVCVDCLMSTDD